MDGAELELERRSKFLNSLIQKKKAIQQHEQNERLNVKVRASDMPLPLQDKAFRCARDQLDSMPGKLDSKRLALALKKEFDSTYGPAWHCIVGTSFGSYVTHSLGDLLQCTKEKNLSRGRAVHARIIRTGSSSCIYLSNSLINLYAKCGDLSKARRVFENIQDKDVVSWNCLINGYSQQGPKGSSFVMELFQRMRADNFLPNAHTFAGVFTAASALLDVFSGQQAHALAIKINSFNDVFVGSSLLNVYCKSALLEDGRKVFDEMPERNSVSWATMISGYAMQRSAVEAFDIFELMRKEEEKENEYVLSGVISALADPKFVNTGRQIHCLTIKDGLLVFASVGNALVTMYAKCGSLDDALKTFELSGNKNSITWSAMITGYAQSGDSLKALRLFSSMHFAGILPSEYTLVGVLNACSDMGSVEEGMQVHSYLLKLGYESQVYIMTALVDMYAKCGSTLSARKGFDYLQEPDMVLWTSMIGGYVQNGENENAMILFGRMRIEGIKPNELTLASILKASSCLAALEQGKQIHSCIIKHGFGLEIPVGSALLTMYAKCGNLEDGNLVFRRMPWRDVVSWNSMISGLAQNGRGTEALQLFEEMLSEGTEPDYITFVNILSACSHMGLVDRGWAYFNMMSDKFGIVPRVEHYACMVDLLGRAGKLEEAKEFIESATIDHGMCLWRILLSSCRNFRNYELGAYAGEKLMELGSQESSAYVLLSSIYIALGRPEDVERVRRMMRLRGVNKEPGCSWIELKGGVHVFVVGDQMHPEIKLIREGLNMLSKQMKDEGYQPSSDSVSATSFSDVELIAACM
ncbi:Dynein light chain, type 1/2 [Corchorus olitorius]|uniref:Dynein light chain, type 1/2 n=1 Tax=Corchorus olitorius TaxID=93759 RepID=A0A1R3JY47_9ROSI|nr:Dynein light chain, type 1/2 [Corchorus olitorius]